MAENTDNQPERQFSIQKIYLKDISFETPNSPEVFTQTWEPQVEVNLGNKTQQLDEGVYEVGLSITLTLKLGEKTAYLIEITQAGIFTASGFEEAEIGHLLGSYCPNLLFPYAREAVSDLVIKGGFPPMLLTPVNFEALYAQHMSQEQEAGQTPPVTKH